MLFIFSQKDELCSNYTVIAVAVAMFAVQSEGT
jgi:hypothetical protein